MIRLIFLRIGHIIVTVILIALVWGGVAARQLQRQIDVEWAATDTEYQRRAEFASHLAQTASAIPKFDPTAINGIGQAQTAVQQIKLDPKQPPIDAGKLEEFDQAQATLTKSLFHVVALP